MDQHTSAVTTFELDELRVDCSGELNEHSSYFFEFVGIQRWNIASRSGRPCWLLALADARFDAEDDEEGDEEDEGEEGDDGESEEDDRKGHGDEDMERGRRRRRSRPSTTVKASGGGAKTLRTPTLLTPKYGRADRLARPNVGYRQSSHNFTETRDVTFMSQRTQPHMFDSIYHPTRTQLSVDQQPTMMVMCDVNPGRPEGLRVKGELICQIYLERT
jgi:hypothetical protein